MQKTVLTFTFLTHTPHGSIFLAFSSNPLTIIFVLIRFTFIPFTSNAFFHRQNLSLNSFMVSPTKTQSSAYEILSDLNVVYQHVYFAAPCNTNCNVTMGCWGEGSDQCVQCEYFTDLTNAQGNYAPEFVADANGNIYPGNNITTCVRQCDASKG